MALVEIARFSDLQEADLAAAFLKANGVTASVADRNLSTIDPLMQRALGGLRVMAPAHEAEAARDLLARAARGEFSEPDGDDIPRPERGAGLTVATLVGAFVFPPAGLAATGARRPMNGLRVIGIACAAMLIVWAVLTALT